MTEQDMLKLLSRGADPRRLSATTDLILEELYDRVTKGEIELTFDEQLCDIVGDYWSVRTTIEAPGSWELRETGRTDARTGHKRMYDTPKYYGATETALPQERGHPLLTAERGFLEEWGVPGDQFEVTPWLLGPPEKHHSVDERFKGMLCHDYLRPSPTEPEIHLSSVYPFLSRVHVSNTRLLMPKHFYRGGRKLKDGRHVWLHLEWFQVFPTVTAGS